MKFRLGLKTRSVAAGVMMLAVRGRAEWIFQSSGTTNANFRAVQAVNAQCAWVGGTGGTCLRTVDGGTTWERLTIPGAEKLDFRGVAAIDSQTAVCASAGEAADGLARIYWTGDGGKNWRLVCQTWEKGVFLDGVAFWDRQNGLAFGDPIEGQWYLLRTADGGRTWTRLRPKQMPAMLPKEAAFAAGNSAMVMRAPAQVWIASGGAEKAMVFSSGDWGETWNVVETPMAAAETMGIFGLRFWDAKRGIGVGGDYKKENEASDNVILTSDGGKTWQKGGATAPAGLKETVVMLPQNALLAVGPSGTSLSRDFGKQWQAVDTNSFHSVSCAGGSCWAVGAHGVIAKWH